MMLKRVPSRPDVPKSSPSQNRESKSTARPKEKICEDLRNDGIRRGVSQPARRHIRAVAAKSGQRFVASNAVGVGQAAQLAFKAKEDAAGSGDLDQAVIAGIANEHIAIVHQVGIGRPGQPGQ
ncbi:hypothetical protein HUU39_16740 [candidate division KSB1 bacterium]|nr:hypothetical protein [candidate division KSB1 bacterium]